MPAVTARTSPPPPSSPPVPDAPRWVLVTGAARRLGRELGLCFARAGWHVLAHHHQSHAEALRLRADIHALGQCCELLRADLSAPDAAPSLLHQAQALTGQWPHCVVNNASLFEQDEALSARPDTLQQHLAVNTLTPLLLANALGAALARAGRPSQGTHSVVHVLDQKVHNLNRDYFSYTLSKLALAQAVALQAQALSPWLRVCGLSPGLMYESGPQTGDNFARASRVNLLHQPTDPAQVARCALFIADNPSLNGCTLPADNGQHLVGLSRDVMFAVDAAPPAALLGQPLRPGPEDTP